MPATVIIGGQWGDDGKGRVVDYHARHCTIIARYWAGTNAGHTIVNDRGISRCTWCPRASFTATRPA
jgi:adenylosuccinate synthase